MRLLLLTLMIVLLPLRGWMGDVMALERSAPEHHAVMAAPVQDDCHEMPQHGMHEEAATPDHAHAEDHCSDCTHCQICHSIALATALLPTHPEQARMRQPLALAQRHASADPSPGFKPPIARI